MKNKRPYYEVVVGEVTILKKTNTLTRAKNFRKEYLKTREEDDLGVGINRLYYDKQVKSWYCNQLI